MSMIRPGIRFLSLLFALAMLLPVSATAQIAPLNAVPALRANVTVTSDVVTIGDLIENAGAAANVPIFRSPDLGTRGTVPTAKIVEAIRPHQLIDIDTRGLAEVVVTHASRAISAQEISAVIAEALSAQYGLGNAKDISVSFDRDVHTLQVEPTATGDLQVLALNYDSHTTRFDVTFDLASSAVLHHQPARFFGTAIETIPAVAVEHPVERGEILRQSDLTILRRPKSEGSAIANVADVVGLAARHELRPGQPLRTADLTKPDVVQRNDTVTIVYQAPGIVLTLRGIAQEAGAMGDSIGVLNADSKRVVQGLVTAPGRVSVTAVTTRVVENTSPPAVVSPSAPAGRSE
jgi:flagella basal body P-ring formation protein FlgA